MVQVNEAKNSGDAVVDRETEQRVKSCEDCHVLSERIRSLAHWVQTGHFGALLTKEAAAAEILKLVAPPSLILGCDRCGVSTVGKTEDFEGWKIPEAGACDDVILCPKCQRETEPRNA